jgi:hypothetical protein
VNRESDEACLELIASIRDKSLNAGFDETERLLVNLEARIEEAVGREPSVVSHAACWQLVGEIRIDKEVCQAENARLRGQLADLGTEFVKLTGEVERLQTECEEKEIVRSCSSLHAPKDAEPEPPTTIGERASPEVCEEFGRAQREDCPCGTETCREAWRELRAAADSEQGAIRFRAVLRTEVAKETAESSREIAVQLMALGERLSAVELHKAANEPGQVSIRFRGVIREEVGREVSRQLSWAFSQSKALREAIEAKDS